MSIGSDRIVPLCDILLGAAHADKQFKPEEKSEVRAVLEDLAGKLPPEVDRRINAFDPKKFDLTAAAAAFKNDSEDERRKLLFLVSAIIESDEEIDFAEDEYLRNLATALALPKSALDGLTVEVESIEPEELKQAFAQVRKGPPPPPGKAQSVDVDLD
jgi:uncharacterized tellurite resistance protein B-like protein